MKNLKAQITDKGRVSRNIRLKYFGDKSFAEIRDWLEENGLDRHMAIELTSTEIAIQVPDGILLQVRSADKNQLGMWGGVLEHGETPVDGALRELYEETGLVITRDDLMFIETNKHQHKYANGDIAFFKSYRFVIRFEEEISKLKLDFESNGFRVISSIEEVANVLSHQQNFLIKLLREPNYQGE